MKRAGQAGAGMVDLFAGTASAPPPFVVHRPKGRPRHFTCPIVFDAHVRTLRERGAVVVFDSPTVARWSLSA